MRFLDRVGSPFGNALKIVDGQHPGTSLTHGKTPKPELLPIDESEEARGVHCRRNVVAAISGTELDIEVVTLACTVAKKKNSSVYLVYGIEVPRKLPIDAEMPEATNTASAALERAALIAEQMKMHAETEIVQSCNFGQSLVDEAKTHDSALVIVGLPYRLGLGGHFDLSEVADYALKSAPCRVWLVRGTPEESERQESASATR